MKTRSSLKKKRINGDRGCDLHRRLRDEMSLIGKGLSESLQTAMQALEERDEKRAGRLIPELKHLQDREGASREVCLRILALMLGNTEELRWTGKAHQILSLMEMSVDEIQGIAQNVTEINGSPAIPFAGDLPDMGRVACGMLAQSTRAVLQPEAEGARKIMATDSSLDRSRDAFAEKADDFLSMHPEAADDLRP
jgi:phosphate uptake regulator